MFILDFSSLLNSPLKFKYQLALLVSLSITNLILQPLLDFLGSMYVLEVEEKGCFLSGTQRKVTLAFTHIVLVQPCYSMVLGINR